MVKNNQKIVLTGDRPTGRLHLGHFVGSIKNRVKLQNEADQSFYMVADIQGLTDNAENPEKIRNNVLEVMLDNLACGLDPKKTTMFIQSEVPEIAELTVLFLNLVTVARLHQNPTVKSEIEEKFKKLQAVDKIMEDDEVMDDDFRASNLETGEKIDIKNKYLVKRITKVPAGFLMYPVSQAADILFCKSNLIPVGEDQLPVIEQANEIVQKFNSLYGETFGKIKPVLSETTRLIGIDGNAKMGKSLNNAIYLSDSYEEISKKVMNMYTDPNHIHVEDKGKVEGNVVFTYLDIFDEKKDEVAELKKQYEKGGLGDVVIKKRLIEILEKIITPIRERRAELAKNPEKVMKILEEGTKQARRVAKETMSEVRQAVKINYF